MFMKKLKPLIKAIGENWFRITILLLVLLVIVMVNGYLQEQNRLAREAATLKQEKEDKEFDAQQKEACLAIYKQESSKWNNVNGWRYADDQDTCYVEYRLNPSEKKTGAECDALYKGDDGIVLFGLIDSWLNCKDGVFENSF